MTRVWRLIVIASLVVLVVQIPLPHATAWHYFEDAADLLVGERRLHLYADRPDLQFGPLSILAALPFTRLGDAGSWVAMTVFSVVGIGVVWLIGDSVRHLRPEAAIPAPVLLFSGILFVAVWGDVAVRTAHIDDAITIAAAVAAVSALARGKHRWVLVALAVAGAAKPWGLIFAPLAAVLPGRYRWWRVAGVVMMVGLTWAPFVIADPATLDVSHFGIANEPSSSLRVLGVLAATTPLWVRPMQLAGGFVLTGLLVGRGRWTAAVMAGVAFRLLIDPAANRYYTVGLVAGILLFQLARHPDRLPGAALAAALVLEIGQFEGVSPALAGWGRLVVTVGAMLAALALAPARPAPGAVTQ